LILAQDTIPARKRPVLKATVININGDSIKGYVHAITDSSLAFASKARYIFSENKQDSHYQVFGYDNIQQLDIRGKSSIRNGLLYGTVAGIVIGAIIGRLSYHSPEPDNNSGQTFHFTIDFGPGPNILAGALLGGAGGCGLGAVGGAIARKTFIIEGRKDKFRDMQKRMKLF